MPGTIQVSVVDFVGLPSSSPPSSISMKVSMGKTEYQTWDKGDFSFPLTTLRHNLTVRLQDAEGNEISHTDVDTMLVVQKGLLDDIFPLKGGGHVRMKLQFILSEEERNRIRIMRESALKKKHSELLGTALSSLSTSKKVSDLQRGLLQTEEEGFRETANQAGPEQNPVNLDVELQSGSDKAPGTNLDDSSTTLNDTDRSGKNFSTDKVSQEARTQSLAELEHSNLVEKSEPQPKFTDVPSKPIVSEGASSLSTSSESVTINSNSAFPRPGENHADKTEKQSSLRKTPNNVRKMISAFENSRTQEMEHHVAPPVTKSQSTKSWKEVHLRNPQKLKETETWEPKQTKSTSEEATDSVTADEFQTVAKSHSTKSWKGVLLGGPQKLKETETWNLQQTKSTPEEARDPVLVDEFQRTAAYIKKRGEQIGSDRDLEESKAPLHAEKFKELSATHIQSKNDMSSDRHTLGQKTEEKRSSENLIRESPVEAATASGGIFNHQGKLQPSDLVTDERDSGGTLVTEKDGVGVQSRLSHKGISQEGRNNAPKPVWYCKDEHFRFDSSANFIFPDDTRRLCITTSNKLVMNVMEGSTTKLDIHQREHEAHRSSGVEGKQSQKSSPRVRKRPESPANSEPTRGLFGQAIKVAIIAGFGTFVLLTRQRSTRSNESGTGIAKRPEPPCENVRSDTST